MHKVIAGVDEAGRGPLAGPVIAAAVILDPARPIDGLNDSKLLSEQKRRLLYTAIRNNAVSWSIGSASHQEIDELNILQATFLAMQRAISGLAIVPDLVLIDGNLLPELKIPAQAVVKGDRTIPSISAASILAKVERDKIMTDYHGRYPEFSFHLHKGYGTKQHLTEIENFGISDIHRTTFGPVKAHAHRTRKPA